MLDSLDGIREELARLEARVKTLEKNTKSPVAPALTGNSPPPATDPYACSMHLRAMATGFTGTKFVRCPDDYYSWTLQERRKYLNAPHITHLTKSIVMENTRHNGSEDPADALRSKYLCVVTPYTAKIDSSRLRTIIRGMYKRRGMEIPSAKFFNYRLVTDCVGVTGYEPNGVTPLGLLTEMPIVLAKEIVALNPAEFWLGGGEVSLKWKVQVDEFCDAFKPVIIDFTEKDE